jgi:hypothetical protein
MSGVAGKRIGRPPINEHGSRAVYAKGCRCSKCRAAEAAYVRARKIGRPAPTTLAALPSVAAAPGKTELAIATEIEQIESAACHPGLTELARVLARDLDNENLAASHASLSRELRAVMETLRTGVRATGKLATLVAMSDRRRPSGADG